MLLDVLKGAGVIDRLCALGDKIVKDVGDQVFQEALIPIFGTLPGLWSLVPEVYFDEAVRFMNVPAEGGLHDKIFSYRNAMANIADNLKATKDDGVNPLLLLLFSLQIKNCFIPYNPCQLKEVIAVADYIPELEALLKKALMTETDLSGLAEWIDVCSIEGDAYVYLPDGPVDTKRVPVHYVCDLTTCQITYQL